MPISDIYKGLESVTRTGGRGPRNASERDRELRAQTKRREAARFNTEDAPPPAVTATVAKPVTTKGKFVKSRTPVNPEYAALKARYNEKRAELEKSGGSALAFQNLRDAYNRKREDIRRNAAGKNESTGWAPKTSGFSAEDIKYIESHGGVVGTVSEAKARQLESDYTESKRIESYRIPGTDSFDITAAMAAGVQPSTLKEAGFKSADISQASEFASLDKPVVSPTTITTKPQSMAEVMAPINTAYATKLAHAATPTGNSVQNLALRVRLLPYKDGNKYDLVEAIEHNVKASTLREAGFSEARILTAINIAGASRATEFSSKLQADIAKPDKVSTKTFESIEDYKGDTGYDIPAAMRDGATRKQLTTLGFAGADITSATKTNSAIATMDKYKDANGYNLLKAAGAGVSAATMAAAGFDDEDIKWATNAVKESKRTGVALPGEKNWYSSRTGKIITDDEYKKLTDNGRNIHTDEYTRKATEVRRGAIIATSTILFNPVKAGLPEIAKSDITKMDWAVGAAQAALWAVPFVPKGAVPYLTAGATGIFGAETAKQWPEMSQNQKILSVAVLAAIGLPTIHGVLKPSFKPVRVPLKAGGEVTVWSGFSARGKPIIGISRAKPNVATVAEGWRPVTKLETSVLGTEKALQQMGVAQAEIDKVLATIKSTKSFKGQRSPYEPKTVTAGEVAPQALNAEELSIVLRNLVKNKKNVAQVYGSTTIKPQLEPGLRDWRPLGDIEAQLKNMSQSEAAALTRKIVTELNKKSKGKFTIDPDDPLRIIKGGHHAVELKLAGAEDLAAIEKAGTSTSSSTGTTSWGMTVAESPIKVEYSGIGELKIMRLSESGVRKTDTITRLAEGGTFAPPAHRLKDIADYYVILRTFKGERVAEAWAKVYGYDSATLLKAAAKNPLDLGSWALDLNAAKGSAAPQISITLPPSAAKLVKAENPELYNIITKPITAKSPIPSSAPARIGSAGLIPSASPGLTPSAKPLPSANVKSSTPAKSASIPSPSALPSPSVSPSPGLTLPSPYIPSKSASPKLGIGKGSGGSSWKREGGGTGITMPSPYPNYIPSTTPIPSAIPEPRAQHRVLLPGGKELSLTNREYIGIVAWRQGMFYIIVYPPYTKAQIVYTRKPVPGISYAKGPQSPQKSAAVIGGKLPRTFEVAMGISKVKVSPSGGRKAPRLEYSRRKIKVTPGLGEVRPGKKDRR